MIIIRIRDEIARKIDTEKEQKNEHVEIIAVSTDILLDDRQK